MQLVDELNEALMKVHHGSPFMKHGIILGTYFEIFRVFSGNSREWQRVVRVASCRIMSYHPPNVSSLSHPIHDFCVFIDFDTHTHDILNMHSEAHTY